MPKGKQRGAFFGGASYGILEGSNHKEEAWKLIKFMVRKEALRQRAIQEQVVPSRISVAESEAFLHLESHPKNRKVFLEAIDYGNTVPATPISREMNDIIWNELNLVILDKKTAKEACEKLTLMIDDLLRYSTESQERRRKLGL